MEGQFDSPPELSVAGRNIAFGSIYTTPELRLQVQV
jgi:hypothetical protein